MNDPRSPTADDTLASIELRSIHDWLATPPAAQAEDELAPLHAHLATLREMPAPAHRRQEALDLLHARARDTIARLLPELAGTSLPLPRRTRQTVRAMQELLLRIAEDYLKAAADLDTPPGGGPPPSTLWRALDALASHLLVSNYVAAPATTGIWQKLHQAYRTALRHGTADLPAPGGGDTPEQIYLGALLLSSAQPASFTSREIDLVVDYIRRFGSRAAFLPTERPARGDSVFWVDVDRDGPPIAVSRQPAPAGVPCFTTALLAELAEEQADALEAGVAPDKLDLPEAAATAIGHGVIRRLAHYWGHPGKRRFPRRRQNYRATLCVGLPALAQLFGGDEEPAGELTSWMVTNESPDGYALMHVAGKTARLAAGDVIAVRTENAASWQVCLVRWALSENPEHLELGVQILATSATPVSVANPKAPASSGPQAALLLPALPPVRLSEALVVPTGAMPPGSDKLVLLIERDNLEVREVSVTQVDEQTGSVEVVAIATHDQP
jgi:cyclic-di-GMP-binding protein